MTVPPWIPLWVLPSLPAIVLVGLWIGGKFSPAVKRVLNRFSRVLFGRFVSDNRSRRRRLEAAYTTETYQVYAAKTYLFVVMGLVAGTILGSYVLVFVFAYFEPIVRTLAGLPDTITEPLGITEDYLLIISQRTYRLVVGGGGLALGILTAGFGYLFRWQLPASTASVRAQGIEEGLPRTAAFMYALSRGGMEFPKILRTLAENRGVYGEAANEMNIAVREMDLFGRDMITALRRMARRTPSGQFKTFAENMTSILQSGSDLPMFFKEQYERFREEQSERQEEVLELLATIAEMYVTVLVAGTLFLITILLVFGLLLADTLMLLSLMIYLLIPLGNAGFALILQQKLDELGIARGSGTEILDDIALSTPINVTPTTATRPDGGVADERELDNRAVLGMYNSVSRLKQFLRNPLRVFLQDPTKLLYVTVPLALVVMLVRLPAAFQAQGVATRILDDIVIQSALFVLITYAIVREYYTRRLNSIENAMPELLERLASLNEAGMSVVEGIRRLRGSDLGVLSPEVERIWRDIEYGSNVDDALTRFGRRVKTTAVTRVVVLLTNAMRASGDMGPVLRVAGEQARAEVKLRRQRKQQMMTYLVVIYVSFFVFLVIVAAINQVLIPSLPDTVPAPTGGSTSRLSSGSSQFDQLGSVNKAAYSLVFFHGAMIQACFAGFIAGQLGEGSLRDGAKHAAIMVTIAYVLLLVLSGPVASITAQGVTADKNNVYGVQEVSLSEGGYIAVYTEKGVDGELLGRTGYLEPGKHTELVIPLNQAVADDQPIRIVAHQDTNGNERFDYKGPPGSGESAVDAPYESVGSSDQPGIGVQITRIDLAQNGTSG